MQRKVFGGMRMGSEVSNNGAATSTSGPEAVVKWNSARAVPFVCPEATALAVSRRQTGASVPQSVCVLAKQHGYVHLLFSHKDVCKEKKKDTVLPGKQDGQELIESFPCLLLILIWILKATCVVMKSLGSV